MGGRKQMEHMTDGVRLNPERITSFVRAQRLDLRRALSTLDLGQCRISFV